MYFNMSGIKSFRDGNFDNLTTTNLTVANPIVATGGIINKGDSDITGSQNISGNLTVSGGQIVNVTRISTTPYNILSSDYIIEVNTSSISITVNLPIISSTNDGQIYIVKDGTGEANTYPVIIFTNNSETIDGAAPPSILNVSYGSKSFYNDGTNWFTINQTSSGGGGGGSGTVTSINIGTNLVSSTFPNPNPITTTGTISLSNNPNISGTLTTNQLTIGSTYVTTGNGVMTFPGSASNLIGDTTVQSLSHKTLDNTNILNNPTIYNSNGNIIYLPASSTTLVGRDTSDTLTNKTLINPNIYGVNNNYIQLPSTSTTLIGQNTSDILSNKSFATDIVMNNHNITGLNMPTTNILNTDAVNRGYANALVSGLLLRQSCNLATSPSTNANLSGFILGGTPASDTFNPGPSSIDGVTLTSGNRVLIKDQTTNSFQNGIYSVTSTGPTVLTRTSDANTSAEVTTGVFTFIESGNTNASTGWVLITPPPIVLDTTGLLFTQFSGAGTLEFTNGLGQVGSIVSIIPGSNLSVTTGALNIGSSGSVNQVLLSSGGGVSSPPTYGFLPLSSTSGTLPVSQGGTNNTSFGSNQVIVSNTAGTTLSSTNSPNITSIINGSAVITVPTITSNLVGDSIVGTLTGKTFTDSLKSLATSNQIVLGTTNTTTINAPTLSSNIVITLPNSSSDTLVGRSTVDTLTNKALVTPVIYSGSNLIQLPSSSTTLIGQNTSDTLSNKTFGNIITLTGGTLDFPLLNSTTIDTLIGANTSATLTNKNITDITNTVRASTIGPFSSSVSVGAAPSSSNYVLTSTGSGTTATWQQIPSAVTGIAAGTNLVAIGGSGTSITTTGTLTLAPVPSLSFIQSGSSTLAFPNTINDTLVGILTPSTLTNKTMPSVITLSGGTLDFPLLNSTTIDTLIGANNSATLTNKALVTPVIYSGSNLIQLPSSSTTLIGQNTGDTLTNKVVIDTSNKVRATIIASNIPSTNVNDVTIVANTLTMGPNFVLTTTGTGNTAIWQAVGSITGAGTVTSITAGNNLTGGTITASGTIGLATVPSIGFISNGSGTLAFPNTGNDTLVGRSTADTLTNKTISNILTNNAGTLAFPDIFSTDTLVGRSTSDTLTNKVINFIATNSGTLAFPSNTNDTLVGINNNATLTNKALVTNNIYSGALGVNTIQLPSSSTTLIGQNTYDTLTNKTIPFIFNTGTLAVPSNVSDTIVGRNTTDTLNNKTFTGIVSIGAGTLIFPNINSINSDTLVGRNTTDTLQNKTINLINTNGGSLNFPTILNGNDTIVGRNTTDTLTMKTLSNPVIYNSNNNLITLPTFTSTLVGINNFGVINLNNTGAGATNTLTGLNNPTSQFDAATKAYVDAIAQGLSLKVSCAAATTVAGGDLSGYTPAGTWTSGSGSPSTAHFTFAGSVVVIDGITISNSSGQRVLVKNQSSQNQNGIYSVTSTSGNLVITRTSDADTNTGLVAGLFTFIQAGTLNINTGWVLTTTSVTLDTTLLVFTQFSGAGALIFNNGLVASGSTVGLNTGSSLLQIIGSNPGYLELSNNGTIGLPLISTVDSNNVPSYQKLDLTSAVKNVLPIANGGTGSSTFASNAVVVTNNNNSAFTTTSIPNLTAVAANGGTLAFPTNTSNDTLVGGSTIDTLTNKLLTNNNLSHPYITNFSNPYSFYTMGGSVVTGVGSVDNFSKDLTATSQTSSFISGMIGGLVVFSTGQESIIQGFSTSAVLVLASNISAVPLGTAFILYYGGVHFDSYSTGSMNLLYGNINSLVTENESVTGILSFGIGVGTQTISYSAGNLAIATTGLGSTISMDTANSAINIGTTSAAAVNISRTGQQTTVGGNLAISGTGTSSVAGNFSVAGASTLTGGIYTNTIVNSNSGNMMISQTSTTGSLVLSSGLNTTIGSNATTSISGPTLTLNCTSGPVVLLGGTSLKFAGGTGGGNILTNSNGTLTIPTILGALNIDTLVGMTNSTTLTNKTIPFIFNTGTLAIPSNVSTTLVGVDNSATLTNKIINSINTNTGTLTFPSNTNTTLDGINNTATLTNKTIPSIITTGGGTLTFPVLTGTSVLTFPANIATSAGQVLTDVAGNGTLSWQGLTIPTGTAPNGSLIYNNGGTLTGSSSLSYVNGTLTLNPTSGFTLGSNSTTGSILGSFIHINDTSASCTTSISSSSGVSVINIGNSASAGSSIHLGDNAMGQTLTIGNGGGSAIGIGNAPSGSTITMGNNASGTTSVTVGNSGAGSTTSVIGGNNLYLNSVFTASNGSTAIGNTTGTLTCVGAPININNTVGNTTIGNATGTLTCAGAVNINTTAGNTTIGNATGTLTCTGAPIYLNTTGSGATNIGSGTGGAILISSGSNVLNINTAGSVTGAINIGNTSSGVVTITSGGSSALNINPGTAATGAINIGNSATTNTTIYGLSLNLNTGIAGSTTIGNTAGAVAITGNPLNINQGSASGNINIGNTSTNSMGLNGTSISLASGSSGISMTSGAGGITLKSQTAAGGIYLNIGTTGSYNTGIGTGATSGTNTVNIGGTSGTTGTPTSTVTIGGASVGTSSVTIGGTGTTGTPTSTVTIGGVIAGTSNVTIGGTAAGNIITINGVIFPNTAPTSGQVLTATSSTTSSWSPVLASIPLTFVPVTSLGTLSFPNSNKSLTDTLVGRSTFDTLTNKTIPSIILTNGGTLTFPTSTGGSTIGDLLYDSTGIGGMAFTSNIQIVDAATSKLNLVASTGNQVNIGPATGTSTTNTINIGPATGTGSSTNTINFQNGSTTNAIIAAGQTLALTANTVNISQNGTGISIVGASAGSSITDASGTLTIASKSTILSAGNSLSFTAGSPGSGTVALSAGTLTISSPYTIILPPTIGSSGNLLGISSVIGSNAYTSWNTLLGATVYGGGTSIQIGSVDNTLSTNNTIYGIGAGSSNMSQENTFIGSGAGASVDSANWWNTYIGYNAGNITSHSSYTGQIGNVCVGYNSLISGASTSYSIALGYNSVATSSNQFMIGSMGQNINSFIAIGGQCNLGGTGPSSFNTAYCKSIALYNGAFTATISPNSVTGSYTLYLPATVGLANQALINTTGASPATLGWSSILTITGTNILFGNFTGSTSTDSIFIGASSSGSNTATLTNVTGEGYNVLNSLSGLAYYDAIFGDKALSACTTCNFTTALGSGAGTGFNASCASNIFIGYNSAAGVSSTQNARTGNNNILIGNQVNTSQAGTNNCIIIGSNLNITTNQGYQGYSGYGALRADTNEIVIGNEFNTILRTTVVNPTGLSTTGFQTTNTFVYNTGTITSITLLKDNNVSPYNTASAPYNTNIAGGVGAWYQVVGSGVTFSRNMIGGTLIFDGGLVFSKILDYINSTTLIVDYNFGTPITGGSFPYNIYYGNYYNIGTITQTTNIATVATGVFTTSMINGVLVYNNGTTANITNTTSSTLTLDKTVTYTGQYTIYYGGIMTVAGNGSTTSSSIVFNNATNSNSLTLSAPTGTLTNYNITLPDGAPTSTANNSYLVSLTTGTMSWLAPSAYYLGELAFALKTANSVTTGTANISSTGSNRTITSPSDGDTTITGVPVGTYVITYTIQMNASASGQSIFTFVMYDTSGDIPQSISSYTMYSPAASFCHTYSFYYNATNVMGTTFTLPLITNSVGVFASAFPQTSTIQIFQII